MAKPTPNDPKPTQGGGTVDNLPPLLALRTRKALATKVLDRLQNAMPSPETELAYNNPYELVVAVVLSAQCTDVRVNQTTPELFRQYPDFASLAQADVEDVRRIIKSISYPNNKARHLVNLGQQVMNDHNGQLPTTAQALEALPGVGRKTANVVASVLHDEPVLPVDTHVFRVANRLRLTSARNVRQSEAQLTEVVPPKLRPKAHHWLILHGRYTCKARTPACQNCALLDLCATGKARQKASQANA